MQAARRRVQQWCARSIDNMAEKRRQEQPCGDTGASPRHLQVTKHCIVSFLREATHAMHGAQR